MKLFQYAVLFHPTEDERKTGKKDSILVTLATILAGSVQEATLIAGRAIPEEYLDRLSQLEVAVRPF